MQKNNKKLSRLKIRAWDLFSEYVRKLENGVCFTCGNMQEWKYQTAGHFINRWKLSVLFDPINVHCQCVECNMDLGGNLKVYEEKLRSLFGDEVVDDLIIRSNRLIKPTIVEYEWLINDIKNKLKTLDKLC